MSTYGLIDGVVVKNASAYATSGRATNLDFLSKNEAMPMVTNEVPVKHVTEKVETVIQPVRTDDKQASPYGNEDYVVEREALKVNTYKDMYDKNGAYSSNYKYTHESYM